MITYYNINGNKGIIKNEIKLKMKLYQSGIKHEKIFIFIWLLSTFILIFLLFFVQLLHYFIMKFSSLSLFLSWFSYFFLLLLRFLLNSSHVRYLIFLFFSSIIFYFYFFQIILSNHCNNDIILILIFYFHPKDNFILWQFSCRT